MVVKGFFRVKDLLICIFFVLLLLGGCVSVDYADDNLTIMNKETNTSSLKVNDTDKVIGLNDSDSKIVCKNSDKVHTVVPKYPTISMWAKPSVRSGYSYSWYKFTWIDYCPNCHHYNALLKNPKGVPEREYTCKYCDSDFDGVVGKEKYSWSRVYLRKC